MKKYILVFIASIIFLNIDADALPVDSIKLKIDSIANAYLSNPQNAGLMIGVFRQKPDTSLPVPYELYSYGVKSKRTNIKPDPMTMFKLGSIGKTFTATVLAYYLVHDPSNVKLSFPMNRYFPATQLLPYWVSASNPNDTFRITLFDLATHHGSLKDQPNNWVPPPGYTLAKLYEYLGSNSIADSVRPLPHKPGTHWRYSNLGFGTLGVILERISGMAYDSLLIKTFCDSLGMYDTRVNINSEQLSRLATGYENGDSVQFGTPTSPGFYGAGGNFSTMNDMIKYLEWNMGFTNSTLNNLLDSLHKERINTGHTDAWVGLAWQTNYLRQDYPQKYVWKDGGTTGYSTFICFIDSTNTGVVVLSNSSNGVDNVGISILRVLNPLKTVSIKNISSEIPETFSLSQNYPNPFNPATKIKFDISSELAQKMTVAKLIVYNALGKEVMTLVNQNLLPGSYEAEFNAGDLPSGIYFYKLETPLFSQTKKMSLLK